MCTYMGPQLVVLSEGLFLEFTQNLNLEKSQDIEQYSHTMVAFVS